LVEHDALFVIQRSIVDVCAEALATVANGNEAFVPVLEPEEYPVGKREIEQRVDGPQLEIPRKRRRRDLP
jgi:hypothetical protein